MIPFAKDRCLVATSRSPRGLAKEVGGALASVVDSMQVNRR
jgi:hypothetical protein